MLVLTKLVAKETERSSLGNVLELPWSPPELDVQVRETEEPRRPTHLFSSSNWWMVMLDNLKKPRRIQSSLISLFYLFIYFLPYTCSFTDHEFKHPLPSTFIFFLTCPLVLPERTSSHDFLCSHVPLNPWQSSKPPCSFFSRYLPSALPSSPLKMAFPQRLCQAPFLSSVPSLLGIHL